MGERAELEAKLERIRRLVEEAAGDRETLFLDTTPDIFAQWLEWETRAASQCYFPSEKGRLVLHRAERKPVSIPGILRLEMSANYLVVGEQRAEGEPPPVFIAPLADPAVSFEVVPLTPERIRVRAECIPEVRGYFRGLLEEIKRRWPQEKEADVVGAKTGNGGAIKRRPGETTRFPLRRGCHGDTLDRVREAHLLISQGICRKTEACRRAGIDPRTYDKWVERVVESG